MGEKIVFDKIENGSMIKRNTKFQICEAILSCMIIISQIMIKMSPYFCQNFLVILKTIKKKF